MSNESVVLETLQYYVTSMGAGMAKAWPHNNNNNNNNVFPILDPICSLAS